jgi:hypothetical protein
MDSSISFTLIVHHKNFITRSSFGYTPSLINE